MVTRRPRRKMYCGFDLIKTNQSQPITQLSISAVVEQFGFVDDTNFSTSCRRWKKMPPLRARTLRQTTPETFRKRRCRQRDGAP
jgi:AraC-like DNA-binding protein